MTQEPGGANSAKGFLREAQELVSELYEQSGAKGWGLTPGKFAQALERSLEKQFGETLPGAERCKEYLAMLHLEDLALGWACLEGAGEAWEVFVRNYREYLRAAAGAVTKGSRSGADARELADSLYAELYGLRDGNKGERSLFRYFHGRSSLKTWLRAILAQRHVDRIRATKRFEPLEGEDGEANSVAARKRPEGRQEPPADPDRQKYLLRFAEGLHHTIAELSGEDRLRLELYYAREQTLAEIGKKIGEHESSVSRALERIRKQIRSGVEKFLKGEPGMSEAEISLCFEYAAEDAPIDFRALFPEERAARPDTGEKGTT